MDGARVCVRARVLRTASWAGVGRNRHLGEVWEFLHNPPLCPILIGQDKVPGPARLFGQVLLLSRLFSFMGVCVGGGRRVFKIFFLSEKQRVSSPESPLPE